jgi:hypothetical protein
MDRLSDLSDAVASHLDRRRFLARVVGLFAAGAAAMVAPALAHAESPQYQGLKTLERGPDAGFSPEFCGVTCSPWDCCSNGCCSGVYLFRCYNNCDHTYFYACSTPCSAFCLSLGC